MTFFIFFSDFIKVNDFFAVNTIEVGFYLTPKWQRSLFIRHQIPR